MAKEVPQLVIDNLQALKKCCIEAQTGAWDKSDDGFDDMFFQLSQIQDGLGIDDDTDYDALRDGEEEE